mgnify:FL=1
MNKEELIEKIITLFNLKKNKYSDTYIAEINAKGMIAKEAFEEVPIAVAWQIISNLKHNLRKEFEKMELELEKLEEEYVKEKV